MDIQSYFTNLTGERTIENNFNRLLLYFLLKLNRNTLVVELLKKNLSLG